MAWPLMEDFFAASSSTSRIEEKIYDIGLKSPTPAAVPKLETLTPVPLNSPVERSKALRTISIGLWHSLLELFQEKD